MRVAATGDLHCGLGSTGVVAHLLEGVDAQADVLLIAGDLTSRGLVEEMEVLLGQLADLAMPIAAVTGNHDHENDQGEILRHMMRSAGIHVLEGKAWEYEGVGFVGVKGFCGGFGQYRLRSFGEAALKAVVHESVAEVIRLERALETLQTTRRVALLHYSPIVATVTGEHPEIYPFLGFSLLADALDRHGVDMIVHGHAHHGAPEGLTPGGIPVRNVAHHVLRRHTQLPYCLFDV